MESENREVRGKVGAPVDVRAPATLRDLGDCDCDCDCPADCPADCGGWGKGCSSWPW